MIRSILPGIILLAFTNTAICKEKWQKDLDSVYIPEYFVQTTPVYLEYIETVKNFKVTAKLFPFDERSETGYVILHFERSYTNESYFYISREGDVYTSHDLYGIVFNKNFSGYRAGETYTFHYIGPGHKKNRESSNPVDQLHPFGYYTPFQFMDIDFDGRTELIINEWDQMKGGNTYTAFDMENNELMEINYVPFLFLANCDKIDSENKTITLVSVDGASEYVEVTYKRGVGKTFRNDFPEFKSWMTSSLIEKPQHPCFEIISIYEKVNDEETIYN